MDAMKRVRLAVLFLLAAVLFAATTASAKEPEFVLSPVGDEPVASGTAIVYYEKMPKDYAGPALPYLSVQSKGLTPGATYRVDCRVSYFSDYPNPHHAVACWTIFETTANNKGAFKGDGWFYEPWYFYSRPEWVYEDSVLVYRVEPTEDVLVLSATRYDPW